MTAPVIETDGRAIVLDLSEGATLVGRPIAGLDVDTLSALIDRAMREAGTAYAFGRWGEPRALYRGAAYASADGEARTVHMGIDVFCRAGTPVRAPEDGVVVSVANNDRELDYGPLVILGHGGNGEPDRFSLYGHLSLDTLDRVTPGQRVTAGDQVASVGSPPSNGNWPPHLHFQLIDDLLGLGADFPGVAAASERARWLTLSPSPARYFPELDAGQLEYR